jgi:leucyl aminopeptidase
MTVNLFKKETIKTENNLVFYGTNIKFSDFGISKEEQGYIINRLQVETIVEINKLSKFFFFINIKNGKIKNRKENIRHTGSCLNKLINKYKLKSVSLIVEEDSNEDVSAIIEGMILSNYQFLKYYKEPEKKQNTFNEINIFSDTLKQIEIDELLNLSSGVFQARDLGNEPFISLNSSDLAVQIKKIGIEAGFDVEVFYKEKIEELKMGGILAVNKGSAVSPTVSILKWQPENAVNKKPYVLIGKGLVYDSGGYSLKPTKNSMDLMKLDMAGAASVIGAFYAIAKNKLPVNIIGLIPSTDNLVNSQAYVPGDIIKMHNGLFVEVLNTDAEGRLILADALSFAQNYEPELVIDLATLTGSAAVAIGTYGAVVMGTADESNFDSIIQSGNNVYERLVRFPFWDEYGELLKSSIADLKNIGGSEAGAVTAGKFLEHFTNYPWIHIDIAGPAILEKNDSYRTAGGSAFGVRLLYDFFKTIN